MLLDKLARAPSKPKLDVVQHVERTEVEFQGNKPSEEQFRTASNFGLEGASARSSEQHLHKILYLACGVVGIYHSLHLILRPVGFHSFRLVI